MKKILIVLMILLFSVSGVFAATYYGSLSLGLSFLIRADALSTSGDYEIFQDTLGLSFSANNYWFPNDSKFGFSAGTDIVFPLKTNINDHPAQVSFTDLNTLIKIGGAYKYTMNDRFRMIASVGYGLAFDEYFDLLHGFFADVNCSYSFNKTIGLSFGLDADFFFIGTATSDRGLSTMKCFGEYITPYVGVSIHRDNWWNW